MIIRLSLYLTAVVLLSGCATAHLSIGVDLYNEDPQYAIPLSPRKTAELRNAVERIKTDAESLAADRIIKASRDQALYDIARCLREAARNSKKNKAGERDDLLDPNLLKACTEVKKSSQEDLRAYADEVWARQKDVIKEAELAEERLRRYLIAYANFWAEKNCTPIDFGAKDQNKQSEDSWWHKLKKKHRQRFDPKTCTYVPKEEYEKPDSSDTETIEVVQEQPSTSTSGEAAEVTVNISIEETEEVTNSESGHVTGRSNSIDTMSESYSRRKKPSGGLESESGFEMRIQETLASDAVNRVAVKYVVLSGNLDTKFEREKAARSQDVFAGSELARLEQIKTLESEKLTLKTRAQTAHNELIKLQPKIDALLNKREKIWSQIESANENLLLPALRSDALFQLGILKEELTRVTEDIKTSQKEFQVHDHTKESAAKRLASVKAELKKLEAFDEELKKCVDFLARALLTEINKYLVSVKAESVSNSAFEQISDYLDSTRLESRLVDDIRDIDRSLSVDRRQEAVENLRQLVITSSIFYNVIDRMQDPSNPVWRLITAEDNEDNWNMDVAGTSFSGQGNSTVVIVRDSPLKFRIQQGANDPTQLIKSQLAISRSIASASISVIAASRGISLPMSTPPGEDEQAPDVSGDREDEEAEKQALQAALQNKADVDLFNQVLKNMERNLAASRRNLDRISDDEEELLKQEQARLEAVLEQHKILLTNMDSNE